MKKKKEKKLSIHSIVYRDPNQEFSKIDDEVIMLNVTNGEYYTLNEAASRIWEMIETPSRVADLVNNLTEEFEIDNHTCEKDTLNCLEDFILKSIIIIKDD